MIYLCDNERLVVVYMVKTAVHSYLLVNSIAVYNAEAINFEGRLPTLRHPNIFSI